MWSAICTHRDADGLPIDFSLVHNEVLIDDMIHCINKLLDGHGVGFLVVAENCTVVDYGDVLHLPGTKCIVYYCVESLFEFVLWYACV